MPFLIEDKKVSGDAAGKVPFDESVSITLPQKQIAKRNIGIPYNTISILDYGADPSGVVDSSPAVSAALAAANLIGATVFIPIGGFSCRQEITGLENGSMVEGEHRYKSILDFSLAANGVHGFALASDPNGGIQGAGIYRVKLKSFYLKGKGEANAGNGVDAKDVPGPYAGDWFEMEDMEIRGWSKGCALAKMGQALIYRCNFAYNDIGLELKQGSNNSHCVLSSSFNNSRIGARVEVGSGNIFTNCECIKNTEADIDFVSHATAVVSNCNMESSLRAIKVGNNSEVTLNNVTFKRGINGAGPSNENSPVYGTGSSVTKINQCVISGANAGVKIFEGSNAGAAVVSDCMSLLRTSSLDLESSQTSFGGEDYNPFLFPGRLDNSIPDVDEAARGIFLRQVGRSGVADDDLFYAFRDSGGVMTWESVLNRKHAEDERKIIKVTGNTICSTNASYEQNSVSRLDFTLIDGGTGTWNEISGGNTGGWRIVAPPGQKIRYADAEWDFIESVDRYAVAFVRRQSASNRWIIQKNVGAIVGTNT